MQLDYSLILSGNTSHYIFMANLSLTWNGTFFNSVIMINFRRTMALLVDANENFDSSLSLPGSEKFNNTRLEVVGVKRVLGKLLQIRKLLRRAQSVVDGTCYRQ